MTVFLFIILSLFFGCMYTHWPMHALISFWFSSRSCLTANTLTQSIYSRLQSRYLIRLCIWGHFVPAQNASPIPHSHFSVLQRLLKICFIRSLEKTPKRSSVRSSFLHVNLSTSRLMFLLQLEWKDWKANLSSYPLLPFANQRHKYDLLRSTTRFNLLHFPN